MTVCNMSIEGGARAGMVAPDETTFDYLRGRAEVPQGAAFDEAVERWRQLPTDEGAVFDRLVEIDAAGIAPNVTWGVNPGHVVPVTGVVPDPEAAASEADRGALHLLTDEREEALITAILTLPEQVGDMAMRREPHHLTTYALELAQQFTQFYDACRVLDAEQPERSAARLTLVEAAKSALASTLRLIGVSAPDEM